MDCATLADIKATLKEFRRSPHGIKPRQLIGIAKSVGRELDNRGKEPTYTRKRDPALSPPLSIPNHGGKDLKSGTARNIIDQLIDDVDDWIQYSECDE